MSEVPDALRLAHLLDIGKWPDAAAELRRLQARVQELESIERKLCEQADVAANAYRELESEAEQNAKIIGASAEKELVEEQARELAAIGAGGVEPLRKRSQAHECRAALAACINLLKKTPKITRDIYVGKDRQAWGVQAKAVLDAALAAQAKQGGV